MHNENRGRNGRTLTDMCRSPVEVESGVHRERVAFVQDISNKLSDRIEIQYQRSRTQNISAYVIGYSYTSKAHHTQAAVLILSS